MKKIFSSDCSLYIFFNWKFSFALHFFLFHSSTSIVSIVLKNPIKCFSFYSFKDQQHRQTEMKDKSMAFNEKRYRKSFKFDELSKIYFFFLFYSIKFVFDCCHEKRFFSLFLQFSFFIEFRLIGNLRLLKLNFLRLFLLIYWK